MITINIRFYDKKTEFIVDAKKIDAPYHLVLAAAEEDEFTGDELSLALEEGTQIDYINCRPFSLTEQIKTYAIERHPDLKDKFDKYTCSFIGRHGLGPEYD